MKHILIVCLLLFATQAAAQDIRPSAYLGAPGKVTVRGGKVLGSTGGVTTIAEQTINPANSATTSIYIDLSTTPAVTTSTSGFPASSYFPICVVIKDANGVITSFTDSRPDFFMGGSSTVSPSSPGFAPGILASNYSSWSEQVRWDCTWSNGSAIITCPSGTFTAADVGKLVFATQAIQTFDGNYALACGSASSDTTILSFQSSTQVTLSANCVANSATNPFAYGPDETVGVNNFLAAVANACGVGILPSGRALVKAPSQVQPPTVNCVNADGSQRHGPYLVGLGVGVSQIIIAPNYDYTKCTVGLSGVACYGATGGTAAGGWSYFNMSFYGLGFGTPTVAVPHNFVEMNSGVAAEHFYLLDIGAGATNLTGLMVNGTPVSLVDVEDDGTGGTGIVVNGGIVWMEQVFSGDNINISMICNGGQLTSNQGLWGTPTGNGQYVVQINGACDAKFSQDKWIMNGPNTSVCLGVLGATSLVQLTDVKMPCDNANGSSIFMGTSGAKLKMKGTNVTGAGTGTDKALNMVAGTTLIEDGLNSFTTTVANILGGTIQPYKSVMGSCTGVGTAASTLGLYGTGPNETLTTCTSAAIGSGIPMDHAGNLQTLQVTVSAAGTNASSGVVTVLKNGVATTITCTVGTATSCQDGLHTVAFVLGDLISLQFTTQAADTLAGVRASVNIY